MTPMVLASAYLGGAYFFLRVLGEARLGRVARWIVAVIGLFALIQGIVMFLTPTPVIAIWPWTLTPLTCRVIGAIFCLGCAGIAVLVDPLWTSVKLMLQVETLMVTLILIAAVRARAEFDTSQPLTWLMPGGFVALLLGSAYPWFTMEIRPRGQQSPSATRTGRSGSAR